MSDRIQPIIGDKPSMFPKARFTSARILVVDDAPFNVKLICAKLTACGYTNIDTAVDGMDALTKTYRHMPDLVLLDIMMPNLDGFGYCDHIRADKEAAYMPIIVQTALEDRDTKMRVLNCGADDFLNKPLDLEEVELRVRVHLERYFMLQDLENIRNYLSMELEHAQETLKNLGQGVASIASRSQLNKHYDVLKTLAKDPGAHH